MSILSRLIHDIVLTSSRIGGATCTQSIRKRHGKEFAKWYNANAPRSASRLGEIDVCLLPSYAHYLHKKHSVGTTQNHLSSIRQLLRAAKVDVSNFKSNASVGVSSRSRHGTKRPFPDEVLPDLWKRAVELDEGMLHVLKIERLIGCRGLESLMSAKSLERWIEELDYLGSVKIESGTKGGRPRWTEIITARADETRVAIIDAFEYLKTHRFFVESGKKRACIRSPKVPPPSQNAGTSRGTGSPQPEVRLGMREDTGIKKRRVFETRNSVIRFHAAWPWQLARALGESSVRPIGRTSFTTSFLNRN